MVSATAILWSPCSTTSRSLHSIQPAPPATTGRPPGLFSRLTLSNASSRTSWASCSCPSLRKETVNVFDRRTFARVRLSWESANATRGGLNEVCISHVPNIRWSTPPSVFVPTMYAPYGIICRTFFFAFLSIRSPTCRLILDGILDSESPERLLPLDAGRARAAVEVAVPVARPRDLEGDLEVQAQLHDLDLRLPAQREEDLDRGLVVAPEPEAVHRVEEVEELRARVRERLRVRAVVAPDHPACPEGLGLVCGEGVEDHVPRGDVSLRGREEVLVLQACRLQVVHLAEEREIDLPQALR